MGYGFVVSVACNYVFTGSYATGAYLLLSLWMIINTVVYSPPIIEFNSIEDVKKIFTN